MAGRCEIPKTVTECLPGRGLSFVPCAHKLRDMSSLPGLKKLAQALDQSRAVERELDQHDQVKDSERLERLVVNLEDPAPAETGQSFRS